MATIKTANTDHIAENVVRIYQEVLEDVSWVAQKAFYTAQRIQDESSSFIATDSQMARVHVSNGWDGIHQYSFFGQRMNDPQQAAGTTWEIDLEQDGEVEEGVARIGTFNPWSDDVLQLNGYSGSFKENEREGGYSSSETAKFGFDSNASFTATFDQPSYDFNSDDYDVHAHVSVHASADSRLRAAFKDSNEKEKDGSDSYSEILSYEMHSEQGLALADGGQGTLDSLRYSSKGTATENRVKSAWDETYQFDRSLEGFGQLVAAAQQNVPGALEQLTQLLLSGDDTITLTGKAGGELSGGAGNDSLTGGKGNDRLSGDAGADILKGGAGKDIFSFAAGDSSLAEPDVVLDFKTRQDKLHLQIDADASDVLMLTAKQASLEALLESAGEAFTQGSQIVFGSDGRKGYVAVDSDGDRQADMLIELAGIKSASKMAVSDFLFS